MYRSSTFLLALLAVASTASASPVPVPENGSGLQNSTAFVDVAFSTSYSQLIMANPTAAASTAQATATADSEAQELITPSNVDIPEASTTYSLTGKLPGKSAAPEEVKASAGASGADESGGIRMVGQDSNPAKDDDDQANSARVLGSSFWAVGAAGLLGVFAGL